MKQNILRAVVLIAIASAGLFAASGSSAIVRGTVKDPTGAVIPGAQVALVNSSGQTVQQTETSRDGNYTFRGVAPGTYSVTVTYSGLQALNPPAVQVAAGQSVRANVTMTVQVRKQELTVTGESNTVVNTEPANNATSIVLKSSDLSALPDDPDDLQADLQALAGPAAGPGGTQFYIDGFSGGQMPPKSSIREIKINTNPFSAQYHRLGYGRIEILTKPGTDRMHGSGYYDLSDNIWNARNPFLSTSPDFRTQMFGGNVSGPISKHASFFIDAQRRSIDDNGVTTAIMPTANFLGTQQASSAYPTPQRRSWISPRIDYQIGANNTLSVRYSYYDNDHILGGIGAFSMPPNTTIGGILYPSTADTSNSKYQAIRLVDTEILNAKVINETHFEYGHFYDQSSSQSTAPALSVASAFSSGGSGDSAPGYPHSSDLDQHYEFQNYTTITWGQHTTEFGLRILKDTDDSLSLKGFNGQWQFQGGTFPILGSDGLPIPGTQQQLTSIDQYLTTIRLLQSGLSGAQVSQMGYGPSKYTITSGNPSISIPQWEIGPFIQDDWRMSPNFTLSLGLRYEVQTNIDSLNNWAPRVGFAWAPGGRKRHAKTVIRGGWGIFYDHFSSGYIEQAEMQNGVRQQVYTLNPLSAANLAGCGLTYDASFSTAPPVSTLAACGATSTSLIYQVDSDVQNPRMMQTAIGVEQQLFSHTTLSVNYLNARGTHQPRLVDINAPYPVPGDLPPGTPAEVAAALGLPISPSTNRPFPGRGDIYNYETDGIYKQNMLLINVNSQVGGWLTLFTRYSHNIAHTNSAGSSTLASDPYDFNADWGRAPQNIENNFFFGGSIMAPWGLRFSPFIIVRSGAPFNLTTGNDLFVQGKIGETVRPSVVSQPTEFTIDTPYGLLNPYPVVPVPGSSAFIPLNEATGPSYFGINLRLSKTWGFGTTKFQGASGGSRGGGGYHHHGFGGFGVQGRHRSSETPHRYNLTLSINARNLLNSTNLNTPIGVITSPKFLESNGITGGYSAESTSSENRRISVRLRFAF
ncbi:MAG TPA: TonB-dependent receptor [Bryobacteraceae bacterium]